MNAVKSTIKDPALEQTSNMEHKVCGCGGPKRSGKKPKGKRGKFDEEHGAMNSAGTVYFESYSQEDTTYYTNQHSAYGTEQQHQDGASNTSTADHNTGKSRKEKKKDRKGRKKRGAGQEISKTSNSETFGYNYNEQAPYSYRQ